MDDWPLILRLVAALLTVVAAVIGIVAAVRKYQTWTKRKALADAELSSRFLSQFNDAEVSQFLSGYVVPRCASSDPNNREGEEYLADIKQSLFEFMDDNIRSASRSYHLILADTGMGKTTFCLNYLAHCRKQFKHLNVCVVSLAGKNAKTLISSVTKKPDTILLADALDEDPEALGRGRDRLSELLEAAADFKCVVITCRSQFFMSDDAIPRETPLPVLVPRQIGQSPTFSLYRSYISPFGPKEIDEYIKKHFPLYLPWRYPTRKRAKELAAAIPDLAHRPMLLERVPDLARKKTSYAELYDLYELLVEGWLRRESRWIRLENLRTLSFELALIMYKQLGDRSGRMRPEEIVRLAETKLGQSPDWTHLTSRSLLNRDSAGNFKFSHKSILEFLLVKMACEGDDRALDLPWTAFMKELFVSWGHTDSGKGEWPRARAMLASNNGRANVAPLFDMLGTTAVRGLPDFRKVCERRQTSTGDRLAPASWRASSMVVENEHGRGIHRIIDHEYNLRWTYVPHSPSDDLPPFTLLDVLNFCKKNSEVRLPSFEQFICLVEGMYGIKSKVLRAGAYFALADQPARHESLLVQIDSPVTVGQGLRIIDRERRVTGTSLYVNSYTTSSAEISDFGTRTKVDQLYIDERERPSFQR